MPMSRAVWGADNSNAASRRSRVGLGRHRADGSVAHLMAWDWSGPGRATGRPLLRGLNPGRIRFTYSDESCCRAARCLRQIRKRDQATVAPAAADEDVEGV